MPTFNCPLCCSVGAKFCVDKRREYFQCDCCGLVFTPSKYWLTEAQEKEEYDKHENNFGDKGYQAFLTRMHEPMSHELTKMKASMHGEILNGLDFGCGPADVLAEMFRDDGHSMSLYDYFYYPQDDVFSRRYDFITATEVVEHLTQPAQVLERLWAALKPGGLLGIMTKRVESLNAFSHWHYKNDPTHIIFFSADTFTWLAKQWSAEMSFMGSDTVIFKKPQL